MWVRVDVIYCDPNKYRPNNYAKSKNQLSSADGSRARIKIVLNFKKVCSLFLKFFTNVITIILTEIKFSSKFIYQIFDILILD